ncbi:MAG: phospho-N-acetylmuramoyl-pentapeptide-transferase [Candidatus Paceibacterota bacterium]
MALYLFVFFVSFVVNFVTIVPFINILYKLKFQRAHQETRDVFNKLTPIFDRFHREKAGTPVGGGLLLITNTMLLFFLGLVALSFFCREIVTNYQSIVSEFKVLLFTFVAFSFLGLYDDLRKMFFWKSDSFFGLRVRHKLVLEVILALIVSYWMYFELKISIINIPFFGVYDFSWLYIPFAAFVIVAFANAVNITDGLDGLASGVLLIALFAFWAISVSILDTPLLIFIAVWLGGLIAFLYFNIYPARLFLGDTGALSFGATFAVIGLLLGKVFALPIIGAVFLLEITTSAIQLVWKRVHGRKFFPVAPLHLWLQLLGWEESKIVARAWIASILFAILGLMIAFLK